MKTQSSYQNPPRTAMEVFNLLPEGTLCEVVENQLYMSPSPNRKHQDLSGRIFNALYNYAELNKSGKVYYAPIDVFIEPQRNAFQPDIIFVSNSNASILSDRGIEGAPDLVVEILSKSNTSHDTVLKKPVYERCGVKELWFVDPQKRSVTGFALRRGKYHPIPSLPKLISFRLLDLKVDLSKDL